MATGRFIPFAQYNQDLTRSMSGLCQLYPSRHITVTMGSTDVDTLVANADKAVDVIRNEAATATEVDYGRIRSELYKAINAAVTIKDSRTDEGAPAMGEINFISHELQGGWMYNDIYVHVTPEEGKQTIIMQPSGFSVNPKQTGLDYAIETKEYRKYNSSRKNLKFDAIIIYYNLHMVDPRSKTADTEPVIVDMPLGIYVPASTVTVQLDNDSIYNQGAAWSTRIVSRIATKSTISAASTDRNNEYATLARVLSEFGDIAETMDKILHQRDGATLMKVTRTTDSLALAPEDIKAYLEEFRRLNAVNVPYIKDNHWFVNGRDLGPVSGEVDWAAAFNEFLSTIDPNDDILNKIRGPQGKPGRDGDKGDPGQDGKPGAPGLNGAKGDKGDDGAPGHTPIITVDDSGWLLVDGVRQGNIKGPKGEKGNDGDTGPQGADGPRGYDGPQGPQGPPGQDGKDGAPGANGTNGVDGHTPTIVVDGDGYLKVDGVRTGPCLIGPAGPTGSDGASVVGEPGKDGERGPQGPAGPTPNIAVSASVDNAVGTPDVEVLKGGTPENPTFDFKFKNLKGDSATIQFYGYTNEALTSSGAVFSPTSQSASTTGLKPKGEPALQLSRTEADVTHQFIWVNQNGTWVLDNWKYVSATDEVDAGVETVICSVMASAGGVVVNTNASLYIYDSNASSSSNTMPSTGIKLSGKINGASDAQDVYITLERVKKGGTKVTTHDILKSIFEGIKGNYPGFKWKSLITIYGSDAASCPIIINFTNGQFQNYCIHDLAAESDGSLKSMCLIGNLHINGNNRQMQKSAHSSSILVYDFWCSCYLHFGGEYSTTDAAPIEGKPTDKFYMGFPSSGTVTPITRYSVNHP